MFSLNTRKLSTTLLISFAILVAVGTLAEASHDLHQRDHVNLKRIVRKRAPQGDLIPGPVIGAAPIPSGADNSTVTDTSTGTTSGNPTDTTSGQQPTDTTTDTATTTPTDTTTETTPTDTSTSTPTTTSTSTPTPTTNTQADPTTAAPVTSTTTSQIKSTKTVVESVEPSETPIPQLTSASSKTSSNIVTILVAIAASLGGVAILWTIFRKWKLGSSKRFEERMQPIDWKTPSHDDGLPSHRRNSASSFNSRGEHSARNGLSPIPDHDFTATGNVSPVGGYADMSRGPSPPMRENRPYEFGSGISGGRY